MKKIVSLFGEKTPIFEILNENAKDYAKSLGLDYDWVLLKPFDKQKAIDILKEYDAGIIDIDPYDESIFKYINKKNKLLVRFGVGYDKVNLEDAKKYDISIARTVGANTIGVAEMAVTLMLSAKRKLRINQNCMTNFDWQKNVSRELFGSNVGIIGFGSIGQCVCDMLKGFGCNIFVYDPFPNSKIILEKNVTLVSLEDIFKSCNTISLHLPLMEETKNLIDNRLLSLMSPDAVIVNTSRGGIINEDDLAKFLRENKIAGAGMDVFSTEPLPTDSPLINLQNAILTPHVSSQTVESLWRIYKMAIDISSDFFNGKDVPYIL